MQAGKYLLDFSKPLIMGILNVTPDSFSDGGLYINIEKAVQRAKQMVEEGADIIDVGGESSRPGSDRVSEQEELRRVLPVIERLVKEINVPVSIDTYKSKVAEECLKRGVHIVNDISGLRDLEMLKLVKKHDVPVIIMHMLGTPKNMQEEINYSDVVEEIKSFFENKIGMCKNKGVTKLILDPGIGFGKTVEHNLKIIKYLNEFKKLNYPLLIGNSRKSFIGKLTGAKVDERLPGTLSADLLAIQNGADIIRVHSVREAKQSLQIYGAINNV